MIESLSNPSSIAVNLLNKGIIQVGTMYWTARINNVLVAQQKNHANFPENSKNQKIIDKSIPPRMMPKRMDFKISVIKTMGVVLLNPNFSSITKVAYILNGKDNINFDSNRIPVNKSPVITEP